MRKIRKSDARISWKLVTNERTDERESSRISRDQKELFKLEFLETKSFSLYFLYSK